MSTIITSVVAGFTLASLLIGIRFIGVIFPKNGKFTKSIEGIDIKGTLFEWIFSAISISIFFTVSVYLKEQSYINIIMMGIAFGSFLMSYGFFIYPFLILFRKNKFKTSYDYQQWAKDNISSNLNVRLLDSDIINAYATGVLSASKVILLSNQLINQMSSGDIKNLIYHEYAHLKYNHLLILYFSNVLCCSLSVISASHFYPLFEETENPGILVAFHGALFGFLYILIPGLVQRKLEYQADRYAAQKVGATSYTQTLVRLNTITKNGLEKKAINYPNLKERISNVSEI
jgi:Zn-dependent protease with chaperone function